MAAKETPSRQKGAKGPGKRQHKPKPGPQPADLDVPRDTWRDRVPQMVVKHTDERARRPRPASRTVVRRIDDGVGKRTPRGRKSGLPR